MHTDETEPTTEGGLTTAELANASERPNSTADMHNRVTPKPMDRADHGERPALFDGGEGERFRDRWSDVQASFVDEPRHAVEQADELVAEVMQRLAHEFASERKTLEQQWASGGDANTEELRQALRRYRSFFDRLLSF